METDEGLEVTDEINVGERDITRAALPTTIMHRC